MTPVDLFIVVHVVAGTLALGSFWIPLVAQKGGRLHRRAGWVYAVSMWVATVFAWVICAVRWTDGNPKNDSAFIFLAFVGLVAANGAATGIRVMRRRSRAAEQASVVDLASSSLFLVASVAMSVWGLSKGAPLFISFGVLGLFLSIRQLTYWIRGPTSKLDWWTTHLGNMIGACIGTVTAFLVVNVPQFGPTQLILWLGPSVVGGIAIVVLIRHYTRKFARPAADTRAA